MAQRGTLLDQPADTRVIDQFASPTRRTVPTARPIKKSMKPSPQSRKLPKDGDFIMNANVVVRVTNRSLCVMAHEAIETLQKNLFSKARGQGDLWKKWLMPLSASRPHAIEIIVQEVISFSFPRVERCPLATARAGAH